ncbi:MAG: chemotaxis response regulator protein-glutamate methylesterase [Pseudomonadota bacterium]
MGIKVLIVDDSATIRAILSEIFKSDAEISHIETAPDAYVARDKIVKNKPDVICLDVDMPKMDGITFLKKMMIYMPIPVIMVSSLTQKGAQTTLDALEAGAIDFVSKPQTSLIEFGYEFKQELLSKVKIAAKSNVYITNLKDSVDTDLHYHAQNSNIQKIIAIGASTGGTEALRKILIKLPVNTPAIIITQHMPENFTRAFAHRLNALCKVDVKEAESGDILSIGKVFIAPGNKHMVLRQSTQGYYIEVGEGKKVSGHKPSVDVMFNSVSKVADSNALGVILTGMGKDGAKGLLAMKKSGALTLGQNKKSCVVYGMPKVAFEIGAVDKQVNIEKMASTILKTLQK